MPLFKYHAYDKQGAKILGEIEADSKQRALELLHVDGLMISSLSEKLTIQGMDFSLGRPKVSLKQLEFLISELSLLLNNGVKIDKGLDIMRQNSSGGPTNKLINNMLQGVRSGRALSDTMADDANTFNSLYINMVKLGEASGNLPAVFHRLALDIRFQSELRAKLIQALTYPMVILAVCVLCIVFVFNYIVPQLSGLFAGIEDLPGYTVALLSISEWFQNYQWFLLLSLVALMIGGLSLKERPQWRKRFSVLAMRIVLLKDILLLAEQIRFNTALGMMCESGIVLDKAIKLASESIKNDSLRNDINIAQQKIRKGAKMSEALANSPLFPRISVSLLEVGEESGRLGPVFDELSHRSKAQFEQTIKKITSVLEPLLILVMGGIVGAVVVTMLLSIVAVNDIGF